MTKVTADDDAITHDDFIITVEVTPLLHVNIVRIS
jgi:hypothetical protein